jgi:methylisocitrate lyase
VIFPEALTSREMFADFRTRVSVPLLANMTEFGKSPYISDADYAEIGYALVLHPATTFRLAARSIKDALIEMKRTGNQETLQRDGRLMPRGEIDGYLKPNV